MTHDLCLGFDTSNYTTSAAFFNGTDGHNSGRLLDVPEGQTGLRQNDVLFQHVRQLPGVVSMLKCDLKKLKAVGAASKPREVEGSYMPCFLAGVSMAKVLTQALDIPYMEFSHQQGHIAAAAWSSGRIELLDTPHLAWHISGGTTELLYVTPKGNNITCSKVGGTTDISAGQLIDRTGVRLGFSFPTGKKLDELAGEVAMPEFFKIKLSKMDFSLSGMENKVMNMILSSRTPADISSFIFASLSDVFNRANENARKIYGELPVLYSGGVSSSVVLRSNLPDGIFSLPEYAADNALGIAILTYREI